MQNISIKYTVRSQGYAKISEREQLTPEGCGQQGFLDKTCSGLGSQYRTDHWFSYINSKLLQPHMHKHGFYRMNIWVAESSIRKTIL